MGHHSKGLEKSDTTELHTLCYWGSRDLQDRAGLAPVLPLLPPSAPGHTGNPDEMALCRKRPRLSPAPGKKGPTGLLLHTCWVGRDPGPDQRLHPRVPVTGSTVLPFLTHSTDSVALFPSAVFQVHHLILLALLKSLLWLPHCPT